MSGHSGYQLRMDSSRAAALLPALEDLLTFHCCGSSELDRVPAHILFYTGQVAETGDAHLRGVVSTMRVQVPHHTIEHETWLFPFYYFWQFYAGKGLTK